MWPEILRNNYTENDRLQYTYIYIYIYIERERGCQKTYKYVKKGKKLY